MNKVNKQLDETATGKTEFNLFVVKCEKGPTSEPLIFSSITEGMEYFRTNTLKDTKKANLSKT